jgi:hypothetical protein
MKKINKKSGSRPPNLCKIYAFKAARKKIACLVAHQPKMVYR